MEMERDTDNFFLLRPTETGKRGGALNGKKNRNIERRDVEGVEGEWRVKRKLRMCVVFEKKGERGEMRKSKLFFLTIRLRISGGAPFPPPALTRR